MTTAKVPIGKPHVRVDEGGVASATPRRGSLLYKFTRMLSFAVALSFSLVVAAATPKELKTEAEQLLKKKQYAAALEKVEEALKSPELAIIQWPEMQQLKIRLLPGLDRGKEAEKIAKDMLRAKLNAANTAIAGADAANFGKPGFDEWYSYIDRVLQSRDAYGLVGSELQTILSKYTSNAVNNRPVLEKIEKYYDEFGLKRPKAIGMLALLREMDAFPKSEAELKIPVDLASFGFDPNRKVVHAKDFGWNKDDATECLTKAVNSDASTVVVDDMGSPWYVYKVIFKKGTGSNKQIVFKPGVKVHAVKLSPNQDPKADPRSYRDSDMFYLNDVSNVVFIGEGKLGDVYIGQFPDRKSRFECGLAYGGCAIGGGIGRNVLVKNLLLANNLMDGFCMHGDHHYLVDCLLDDNLRQGLSIVKSHHCVYKNVTFSRTVGAEPHNGVDFEPPYAVYDIEEQYFFDCKFHDNAAGNVTFSTSNFAPATYYFKRCKFGTGRYRNIVAIPRATGYIDRFVEAPSDVRFEDCEFEGYSDAQMLIFNSALLNFNFINCTFTDKGRLDPARTENNSPIYFHLDRAFWEGYYPKSGKITFEKCKVNGFENRPLVRFGDFNGKFGIAAGTIRGKINHNGKEVDLSKFSYLPADLKLRECAEPALDRLTAVGAKADDVKPGFALSYARNWYHPMLNYEFPVAGTKGVKGTLAIEYLDEPKEGYAARMKCPSGKEKVLLPLRKGAVEIPVAFDEDGTHLIHIDLPGGEESLGFKFLGAKGISPAYIACDGPSQGRVAKLTNTDGVRNYVGYFEVMGGTPFVMKLLAGGVEIRDETGARVIRREQGDYMGTECLELKPKKDAIWSLEMLEASFNFKFFEPMTGIWADDPEALPTLGKGLSFTRVEGAATKVAAADEPAKPLPETYRDEVKKLVAERLAAAEKSDAVKKYEEALKSATELQKKARAANDEGLKHEVDDIMNGVNRLKHLADAVTLTLNAADEERTMAAVCARWTLALAPEYGLWSGCSFNDGAFTYPSPAVLKSLYNVVVGRLK